MPLYSSLRNRLPWKYEWNKLAIVNSVAEVNEEDNADLMTSPSGELFNSTVVDCTTETFPTSGEHDSTLAPPQGQADGLEKRLALHTPISPAVKADINAKLLNKLFLPSYANASSPEITKKLFRWSAIPPAHPMYLKITDLLVVHERRLRSILKSPRLVKSPRMEKIKTKTTILWLTCKSPRPSF